MTFTNRIASPGAQRPVWRRALLVLTLLSAVRALPARAQDTAATQPPAQPQVRRPVAAADDALLDAPVSRAQYRLGPGDVVTVSVTGNLNRVWEVPVGPEGALVVPEMGVTRVLNLNLDEAQARVRDLVLRFYQGVSVNLTLASARRFRVFVVGSVARPGARAATPATRVSDLVAPDNGPSTVRNVIIRHAAGDSTIADLVRFRQAGDLAANPTLREGDVLVVPTADRSVQVFGRVYFPGTYEYRAGETLAGLLAVVNGGGGFPSNAADTVRVSRFTGQETREFFVFSRAEATGAGGAGFRLQPSDAVYVAELANFQEQRSASVAGQVLRPGRYPIRRDTTTLRELVAMAGGFTDRASLADAVLRRQLRTAEPLVLRQLRESPPELLSDEERRVLAAGTQGDRSVVVVDMRRLFEQGEDALDLTLQDGDALHVPERGTDITVLGAVLRPGVVEFVPGRGIQEYVRAAGGYARRASRGEVTVIRVGLGARMDARDVQRLEAGDQIVVPVRRRVDPLRTISTVQVVVTTVSGLILSFLTLRELRK
ncbi:MAG TPA: SLBB domain-containing protein [Longimicrobium sp.]|uniref:polysaccharide biosynthesis/export family protein n=1 Tax=Longimicrobium sp. TaxID=2029185 RepID=UPI002ED9E0B6